jgi:licheninase
VLPKKLLRRRAVALVGSLVAVSGLAVATPAAGSASTAPTNAGKVHRWGLSQWHYGFTRAHLTDDWTVGAPAHVRLQHGMLTIDGDTVGTGGTARLNGHDRTVGRWETRLRSRSYGTGHGAYHVVATLAPAAGYAGHCGGRDADLTSFTIGAASASTNLRNVPDLLDTYQVGLDPTGWHDYAVEVTDSHVKWFVDGQTVMTDRRPDILTKVPVSVVFRLEGDTGRQMDAGRMQMDWLRYYTLARTDVAPSAGARAARRSNPDAC